MPTLQSELPSRLSSSGRFSNGMNRGRTVCDARRRRPRLGKCMSLGKTELLVRRAVNSVRVMVVLAVVVPGADGQALVVRGERLV
jgi:hypothetical protein